MRRMLTLMTVMAMTVVGAGLAGPAFAQTETYTITEKQPFSTTTQNPCNGEYIRLTGETTYVFHRTVNDNILVGVSASHTIASGIGTQTGAEYKVRYTNPYSYNIRVGFSRTSVSLKRFIGAPEAPNFLGTFVAHTTVNDYGETTSEFSFSDLKCTG